MGPAQGRDDSAIWSGDVGPISQKKSRLFAQAAKSREETPERAASSLVHRLIRAYPVITGSCANMASQRPHTAMVSSIPAGVSFFAHYLHDIWLNAQLLEAIAKHPTRFAGLTAIAPQDPKHAAREIDKGAKAGLKGVIINSHTNNEYLDDPKFWEIF